MQKGISEYQMSYDLGHSKSYINNITSGKSLPSLSELFSICDYFGISPSAFFDEEMSDPKLISDTVSSLKRLDSSDILLIRNYINRLQKD